MDNCVLIRVAAAIDAAFRQSVLQDVQEESDGRLRFLFERAGESQALLVSPSPELPWVGRPARRWAARARRPDVFGHTCLRELGGSIVSGAEKPPAERCLRIQFADGRSLVAELAMPSSNLILLDGDGRITALVRSPRSPAARLRPGEPYRLPPAPASRLDPFRADTARIDAAIEERLAAGDPLEQALRRSLLGIGRDTAELLVREWRPAEGSPGTHLARRLGALERGELDPVIETDREPGGEAEFGGFPAESSRLWPWRPADPPPSSRRWLDFGDPAETAGFYHDVRERARALRQRGAWLRRLLEEEIRRKQRAEASALADLQSFSDPEKYRRWGEALLAGLSTAEPAAEGVRVVDPYDPDGRRIVVPVSAGMSLPRAAEDYFQRCRRAKRGVIRALERVETVVAQKRKLEELHDVYEGRTDSDWMDDLERLMREQGIPVGLERVTRATKASARLRAPRVEGVRLFTSSDGLSILVGKGGRENQRLTFKLAHPEDFWFHAQGVAGAHVLVRNDERRPSPPAKTLLEAAAAAAWYSDARSQTVADVQWTRRKFVRKLKGAPPGTVRIKKFETVRVRPRSPAGAGGS